MKDLKYIFYILLITLFASCKQSSTGSQGSSASGHQSSSQSYTSAEEQARIQEQLLLQQQRENYRYHIIRVLKADAQTPVASNGNYSVQAQEMRGIDLTGCPEDFKTAYLAHFNAWSLAGDVQKALNELRSDENVTVTVVASLLARLSKSDATPIIDELSRESKLEEAEKRADNLIHSTWADVERIANVYGARI